MFYLDVAWILNALLDGPSRQFCRSSIHCATGKEVSDIKLPQSALYSSIESCALVAKIQCGDPTGSEELDRWFSAGIRLFLSRRLGVQQLETRVQETFTILLNTIQTQGLREDEPMVGLVRAIVLKQILAYSEADLQKSQPLVEVPGATLDHRLHPDEKSTRLQNRDLMVNLLRSVRHRDQDALTRFYSHEQTQETICEALQLSETQFLVLKADVKAHFAERVATLQSVTS